MDLNKRKFKLVNSLGEERDLLGQFNETLPFMHKPDGLGAKFTLETRENANVKVITSIENNFPDIKCELIFDTYEKYSFFWYWVSQSQKKNDVELNPNNCLRLYYQSSNNEIISDWYYIVYLRDIEKSEKDVNTNLLICPVVFERLSNYRKDFIIEEDNITGSEDPATFPLPTPTSNFITFGEGFKNDITIKFTNFSNMDIPCKLELIGGYTNPKWENLTNKTKGQVFSTRSADGNCVWDSNPNPVAKVEEGNLNATVNAFDICNWNYENILYLSPGVNEIRIILNSGTEPFPMCKAILTYSMEEYTG